MKWVDGRVKALSVLFCTNQNEETKMNYEDKVHKVVDIFNNWQNKRLTLSGNITIIETWLHPNWSTFRPHYVPVLNR